MIVVYNDGSGSGQKESSHSRPGRAPEQTRLIGQARIWVKVTQQAQGQEVCLHGEEAVQISQTSLSIHSINIPRFPGMCLIYM